MHRYQVTGIVRSKGKDRTSKQVVVNVDDLTAKRIFSRDNDVVRIISVEDVTDVDTGWDHVAYVRSSSEPDRYHEIRRNRKSDVVACGCLEYRFCRGFKTCHHLKALTLTASSYAQVQTVTIASANKAEHFTVIRRSISLTPMSMQSIATAPAPAVAQINSTSMAELRRIVAAHGAQCVIEAVRSIEGGRR